MEFTDASGDEIPSTKSTAMSPSNEPSAVDEDVASEKTSVDDDVQPPDDGAAESDLLKNHSQERRVDDVVTPIGGEEEASTDGVGVGSKTEPPRVDEKISVNKTVDVVVSSRGLLRNVMNQDKCDASGGKVIIVDESLPPRSVPACAPTCAAGMEEGGNADGVNTDVFLEKAIDQSSLVESGSEAMITVRLSTNGLDEPETGAGVEPEGDKGSCITGFGGDAAVQSSADSKEPETAISTCKDVGSVETNAILLKEPEIVSTLLDQTAKIVLLPESLEPETPSGSGIMCVTDPASDETGSSDELAGTSIEPVTVTEFREPETAIDSVVDGVQCVADRQRDDDDIAVECVNPLESGHRDASAATHGAENIASMVAHEVAEPAGVDVCDTVLSTSSGEVPDRETAQNPLILHDGTSPSDQENCPTKLPSGSNVLAEDSPIGDIPLNVTKANEVISNVSQSVEESDAPSLALVCNVQRNLCSESDNVSESSPKCVDDDKCLSEQYPKMAVASEETLEADLLRSELDAKLTSEGLDCALVTGDLVEDSVTSVGNFAKFKCINASSPDIDVPQFNQNSSSTAKGKEVKPEVAAPSEITNVTVLDVSIENECESHSQNLKTESINVVNEILPITVVSPEEPESQGDEKEDTPTTDVPQLTCHIPLEKLTDVLDSRKKTETVECPGPLAQEVRSSETGGKVDETPSQNQISIEFSPLPLDELSTDSRLSVEAPPTRTLRRKAVPPIVPTRKRVAPKRKLPNRMKIVKDVPIENLVEGDSISITDEPVVDEPNSTPKSRLTIYDKFSFQVEDTHLMKLSGGEKLYACDICDGVYQRAFSLKRHYLRSHINYRHLSERDIANCGIVVNSNMAVSSGENTKITMQNSKVVSSSGEDRISGNEGEDQGLQTGKRVESYSDLLPSNETQNSLNPPSSEDETLMFCKRLVEDLVEKSTSPNSKLIYDRINVFANSEINDSIPLDRLATTPDGNLSRDSDAKMYDLKECVVQDTLANILSDDSPRDVKIMNFELNSTDGAAVLSELFRCHLCGLCFDLKTELKIHLANHPVAATNDANPYRCSYCQATFSYKTAFLRHLVTHTNAEPAANDHLCLYCDKQYSSSGILKRHVTRLHEVTSRKSAGKRHRVKYCLFCPATDNKKFNKLNILLKHMIADHSDVYHACSDCETRFLDRYHLDRHNRLVHGAKRCEERTPEPTSTPDNPSVIKPDTVINVQERATSTSISSDNKVKNIENVEGNHQDNFHYSCAICHKLFTNYVNMCRHRRLAHGKALAKSKKSDFALKKYKKYNVKTLLRDSPPKVATAPGAMMSSSDESVVDPETLFYLSLADNIRENLLNHLDGRLGNVEEPEDVVKEAEENVKKMPVVATLVRSTEIPRSNESEKSFIEPEKAKDGTTNPTKELYVFPKKYEVKRRSDRFRNSYNKDMSYLDISTQLIVKRNTECWNSRLSESSSELSQELLATEKLSLEFLNLAKKPNPGFTYSSNTVTAETAQVEPEVTSKQKPTIKPAYVSSRKLSLRQRSTDSEVREVSEESVSDSETNVVATSQPTPVEEVPVAPSETVIAEESPSPIVISELPDEKPDHLETSEYSTPESTLLESETDPLENAQIPCDPSSLISIESSKSQEQSETNNEETPAPIKNCVATLDDVFKPACFLFSVCPADVFEFSGDWVRPRTYVCAACNAKFADIYELQDHKWSLHPNAWVSHFEFYDAHLQATPTDTVRMSLELYKRYLKPQGVLALAPPPVHDTPLRCSKCARSYGALADFHRHLLECGGDTIWMTTMFAASPGAGRRNRKWRPFGSRRRKHQGRRGMKRNIPNTPMKMTVHKSRSRTNDTESIQRMIANLPAKRSTRRAIQFKDDDIKTRSQATIHSVTFASNFTRPSLKSRKERDRAAAKIQTPSLPSEVQPAAKKKKQLLIQSHPQVVPTLKKPASVNLKPKLIQSSLNFPKRRHFQSKLVAAAPKEMIKDTLNRVTRKSLENLMSPPLVAKKRMGRPPKRQSLPIPGQSTITAALLSKPRSSSVNSAQAPTSPTKTLRARSKPAEVPSPVVYESGENNAKIPDEGSVEKLEKSETTQILAEMRKAMLVNEIRLLSQQQKPSKTKPVTLRNRKVPAPGRLGIVSKKKKLMPGSVNSHKISSFFPKIVPQTRQRQGLNSVSPTITASPASAPASPSRPSPSLVETTAKLKRRLEEKRKSLSLSTLPTDIPSEVLHSVLENNSKKVSARRVKSKRSDKPTEIEAVVPSTSKEVATKTLRTKLPLKLASLSTKRSKTTVEDPEERFLRIKGYVPPEELSKEPIMCPGCGLEFHNHAACERHRRKCSYTQPAAKPSDLPKVDVVEPAKKFACTVCGTEFNHHNACNRHEAHCLKVKSGENKTVESTPAVAVPSVPSFICPNCGAHFANRSTGTKHQKRCLPTAVATEPESNPAEDGNGRTDGVSNCQDCGVVFSSHTALTRHRRKCVPQRKTPPPEALGQYEPIICSSCAGSYTNRTAYMRHRKKCLAMQATKPEQAEPTVDAGGPFICARCGVEFGNHAGCERHQRKCVYNQGTPSKATTPVTNTSQYQCSSCKKRFVYKGRFDLHKLTCKETKPVEMAELPGDVTVVSTVLVPEVNMVLTDPVIDSLLDIPEDAPLSMLLPKGRSFTFKKLSKPIKRFIRKPRTVRKNEKIVRRRKSARLRVSLKKTLVKKDKIDLDKKMPELEKQEPIMNMPVVSPSNLSDIPILSPFSDVAILDEERIEDRVDKVVQSHKKKNKRLSPRTSKPVTPESNVLPAINPNPTNPSKLRQKPASSKTPTKGKKLAKKTVKEQIPQVEISVETDAPTILPLSTIVLPDSELTSPLSMPPLSAAEHFPAEAVAPDDAINRDVIDIAKLQATAREVELEASELPSLRASPSGEQILPEVTPADECMSDETHFATGPDSAIPSADLSENIQRTEEVILATKPLNVQESNRISRPVKRRVTRKAQARTNRDKKPIGARAPSTRKKPQETVVVQNDDPVIESPVSMEPLVPEVLIKDVSSSTEPQEQPDCSKIGCVENPSSTLLLAAICQDNAVSLKSSEEIQVISSIQGVPEIANSLESFKEKDATTPTELEIVEIVLEGSNAKKSSLSRRPRGAEERPNKRKKISRSRQKTSRSKIVMLPSSTEKMPKPKKVFFSPVSTKNNGTIIEVIDMTGDSDDEIIEPTRAIIPDIPNTENADKLTAIVESNPTDQQTVEMEDITERLIDIPETSNLSTLPTSVIDISKDTFSDSPMSFEIPATKTYTNSIEQEISDIISFLENPRNEADISSEDMQVLETRKEETYNASKSCPMEKHDNPAIEVTAIDNIVSSNVSQVSTRLIELQDPVMTVQPQNSELPLKLSASNIGDGLAKVTKPIEIATEHPISAKLPPCALMVNPQPEKLTMLVTLPISEPFGQLLKSVLQRKVEPKPLPIKPFSELPGTPQNTPLTLQEEELHVEKKSVPQLHEDSLPLMQETSKNSQENKPLAETAKADEPNLTDIQSTISIKPKPKQATVDRSSVRKARAPTKRKRSTSAKRAASPPTLAPRERSVRRTRCHFSYEEMCTSDVASEASSTEFIVTQPLPKKTEPPVKPAEDPKPEITTVETIDEPAEARATEEQLQIVPDPVVEVVPPDCKTSPNETTKVAEESVEPKRKRRKNSLDTHYFCDTCTKHYYSNYNLVKHKESAGHKLKEANLHAINNPIEDFQATEDENAFNEIAKLDLNSKLTKKLDNLLPENVVAPTNYLSENFAKDSELRINQAFGNYESVSNWLDQQLNEQMDTDWIEPELSYNLDSPEAPTVLAKPVTVKQTLQHSEDIDSILNSDHMKDLQKAMGATDDEMLMLQRLGAESEDDWTHMITTDKTAEAELSKQKTAEKQVHGERKRARVDDVEEGLNQGESLKRYMTTAFSGLLDRAHTMLQDPWQMSGLALNTQTLDTIRRLAECRQQASGKRVVDSDARTPSSKEDLRRSAVSHIGNSLPVHDKVTAAVPLHAVPESGRAVRPAAASLAESSHSEYIESPLEMLASQATKIVNRGLAGTAVKTSHDSEKDIEITKTKSKILQCVYLKKAKTLSSDDLPTKSVQKTCNIKGSSRRKKVMKKFSNPVKRELVKDKLSKEYSRDQQKKEEDRCKVSDVAISSQKYSKSEDKLSFKNKEVSGIQNAPDSKVDVKETAVADNNERLLAEAALRDLNKGRIQKPSNHRFWGNNHWGMHQYKFVKSDKKVPVPATPAVHQKAERHAAKSSKQKNIKSVRIDDSPSVVDLDMEEGAQFDVYDFNDEEVIAPFRESGFRNTSSTHEPDLTIQRPDKKQSAEKQVKSKKPIKTPTTSRFSSPGDAVSVKMDNLPKMIEEEKDKSSEQACIARIDEAQDDLPVELLPKSRRGRTNVCYTEIFDDVFSDTEDFSYIDFDEKPVRKKAAPRKLAPKPLPKAPPKGKKNNILSCVFGKARRNSNITAGSDISDVDREYIAKAKSVDSEELAEDRPVS